MITLKAAGAKTTRSYNLKFQEIVRLGLGLITTFLLAVYNHRFLAVSNVPDIGLDNAWAGHLASAEEVEACMERAGFDHLTINGQFLLRLGQWMTRDFAQTGEDHYLHFVIMEFGMRMPIVSYKILLPSVPHEEVITFWIWIWIWIWM